MIKLQQALVLCLVLLLSSCFKANLLSQKTLDNLNLDNKNNCPIKNTNIVNRTLASSFNQYQSSHDEIEGTYDVIITDDLINGKEKQESFIYTSYDEGTRYKIQNSEIFSQIRVGTKVKVSGLILQPVNVTNDSLIDPEIYVGNISIIRTPMTILKNYSLKVLVVLMNFNNRVTTNYYTEEEAKKDIKTIADYYRRVSGNQINMQTDVDGDGFSDVEVVNMGTDLSTAYCTPDLAPYVRNKLVKYKLSDYSTVVYVHTKVRKTDPPQNDGFCPYGGVANLGELGSGLGGRTHIGVPMISVTRHELGHTFGLGHSGKGNCTYCDQIDPMGNYFGNENSYFNGPKIKQLGLFDNHKHLEQEISSNGVYPISAVGLGVESSNDTPRLLTITNASRTAKLYLTYRFPAGEDAKMPSNVFSIFKGIVVNVGSIGRGGESSYEKVLKNINDTYTAKGMTVKLVEGISHEETEVEVTIDDGGSGGGGGSQTPTPIPTIIPKCSKTVDVKVTSISKKNNIYEVAYMLTNNNDSICGELFYKTKVTSNTFTLAEESSFNLKPQSSVSVITKLKLKAGLDLSKVVESDGELIGVEQAQKVPDFSISLKTKLVDIPSCK